MIDGNQIDIPINFHDEANGGFKSTFDHTTSKHQDFLSFSKWNNLRKKKENTSNHTTKICNDLKAVLVKAAHKVKAAEEKRESEFVRLRSNRIQSNWVAIKFFADHSDFHIKVSKPLFFLHNPVSIEI